MRHVLAKCIVIVLLGFLGLNEFSGGFCKFLFSALNCGIVAAGHGTFPISFGEFIFFIGILEGFVNRVFSSLRLRQCCAQISHLSFACELLITKLFPHGQQPPPFFFFFFGCFSFLFFFLFVG